MDLDGRAAGAEQRARDAAQRAREAEQRAREAEARLTAMANKDNLSQSEVEISVNIGLLKSGADAQKLTAAAALADLAQKNPDNKIGEMGGIPPLVAAMASGTTNHEDLAAMAALALLRLLLNGRNGGVVELQNEKKIVEANGIPMFVKLLSYGKSDVLTVPTMHIAAHALFVLTIEDNDAAIVEAGGIPPLVAILQSGTDPAKRNACLALQNLSIHDINKRKTVAAGSIPLLVTLLNADVHKVAAVDALYHLALLDNHKVMITAAGAIPPLVEMLKDQQKQAAALKLLYELAKHEANKMTIGSAGSIPPLFAIIKEGRTEQVLNVTIERAATDVLRLLKQDANIAPMIQSENETWYADEAFVMSLGENGWSLSWRPGGPSVNLKFAIVSLFKSIDKNGNGLITKDEILDAVRSGDDDGAMVQRTLNLAQSWPDREVHNLEAVFQDMDKDGSSEVDLAEFANYVWQKCPIPGIGPIPFEVEMKNGQLVMKSGQKP